MEVEAEEDDGPIGASTGLLSGGSRIEGILTTVFNQTLGEVDILTGYMNDPKEIQVPGGEHVFTSRA